MVLISLCCDALPLDDETEEYRYFNPVLKEWTTTHHGVCSSCFSEMTFEEETHDEYDERIYLWGKLLEEGEVNGITN